MDTFAAREDEIRWQRVYHPESAGVAQLVEHRFCKPGAAGSSPASGSLLSLSIRATFYAGVVDHPKDVDDRTTLAVMLALRNW